jgi:ribonuclease E
MPQPFEPVAREPAPEPMQMPSEPPRRRSTVREPAPMFSSGAMSDVQPVAAPESHAPEPTPPQPAAAEPAEEAKPRRFGWWNRRG